MSPEVSTSSAAHAPAPQHAARAIVSCCALSLLIAGCTTGSPRVREQAVDPIRVSYAIGQGDPARRASIQLVVQGLDADSAGAFARAQGSYEQAIQVDPTNPYAYLALARHHLDAGEAELALSLLDQAAAFFEAEGMRNPRVGVHLLGLRGSALHATGRGEDGVLYLERARTLSPELWRDGHLSAEELR